MILFEASHTSHTHAQTGVQRVVRSIFTALSAREKIEPVCYDPHQATWRGLQPWEQINLANTHGAGSAHRSAKWPLRVRLDGYTRQFFNARSPCPTGDSLIAPEIFSAKIARAYPQLFAQVSGPRVAVFHDAIALKLPEYTPAKTVGRFPAYLRELLAFDGVAAVSEDSRHSLINYWSWLGVANPPPVIAIANAVEISGLPGAAAATTPVATTPPVVLCVGSLEGRKNHVALLEACEQLWTRGLRFQLRLIGLAHPQTGKAALDKMNALQAAGYPLRYDGPVDDAALHAAYAESTFTVYPSLMEGFGLPVQESLAHGKPCICSSRGALGESAKGGGCIMLDSVTAAPLAEAIDRLLTSPSQRVELTRETQRRTFKTWATYADDLTAWMQNLPRR